MAPGYSSSCGAEKVEHPHPRRARSRRPHRLQLAKANPSAYAALIILDFPRRPRSTSPAPTLIPHDTKAKASPPTEKSSANARQARHAAGGRRPRPQVGPRHGPQDLPGPYSDMRATDQGRSRLAETSHAFVVSTRSRPAARRRRRPGEGLRRRAADEPSVLLRAPTFCPARRPEELSPTSFSFLIET